MMNLLNTPSGLQLLECLTCEYYDDCQYAAENSGHCHKYTPKEEE